MNFFILFSALVCWIKYLSPKKKKRKGKIHKNKRKNVNNSMCVLACTPLDSFYIIAPFMWFPSLNESLRCLIRILLIFLHLSLYLHVYLVLHPCVHLTCCKFSRCKLWLNCTSTPKFAGMFAPLVCIISLENLMLNT